jgi:hypothetical protein
VFRLFVLVFITQTALAAEPNLVELFGPLMTTETQDLFTRRAHSSELSTIFGVINLFNQHKLDLHDVQNELSKQYGVQLFLEDDLSYEKEVARSRGFSNLLDLDGSRLVLEIQNPRIFDEVLVAIQNSVSLFDLLRDLKVFRLRLQFEKSFVDMYPSVGAGFLFEEGVPGVELSSAASSFLGIRINKGRRASTFHKDSDGASTAAVLREVFLSSKGPEIFDQRFSSLGFKNFLTVFANQPMEKIQRPVTYMLAAMGFRFHAHLNNQAYFGLLHLNESELHFQMLAHENFNRLSKNRDDLSISKNALEHFEHFMQISAAAIKVLGDREQTIPVEFDKSPAFWAQPFERLYKQFPALWPNWNTHLAEDPYYMFPPFLKVAIVLAANGSLQTLEEVRQEGLKKEWDFSPPEEFCEPLLSNRAKSRQTQRRRRY